MVKGVRFVDLTDEGDPVELAARYDAEGADEVTFLDITASSDERATMVEVVARTAEQVFIPLTVGGGVRAAEDARRLLRAGADKVAVNTAAVERPGSGARHRGRVRRPVRRRGHRCPSPPRRRGRVGGLHARRADPGRPRRGGLGRRVRGQRRRRDPADVHGPRRHAGRLRSGADARRGGRRGHPGGGIRRRGRAAGPGRRRASRAEPMPSWRRRSSTAASSPSARPRPTWRHEGSPFAPPEAAA